GYLIRQPPALRLVPGPKPLDPSEEIVDAAMVLGKDGDGVGASAPSHDAGLPLAPSLAVHVHHGLLSGSVDDLDRWQRNAESANRSTRRSLHETRHRVTARIVAPRRRSEAAQMPRRRPRPIRPPAGG